MTLAVLAASILLLLLLIAVWRWNAFLALVVTALLAGLANGLTPEAALKSVMKGIGDTAGSLALLLAFGAILGKQIEESGAAHTISLTFARILGERRLPTAILLTGFLVGLPMVYNASFLVLIPLVYTLSATTGIPLLQLGIPLSSALSVAHGYLPPHPAPSSIAAMFGADPNKTLLYGLLLAVPATILAGPVLARFFRDRRNVPPPELFQKREFRAEELPGFGVSMLMVVSPVLLMVVGLDPTAALLLAVLLAFALLKLTGRRTVRSMMESLGPAIAGISMVLFIIAGGGAFKQVLLDSGTGNAIQAVARQLPVPPLVLAWTSAALLRLALGSATVAAITAAGIILPLIPGSNTAPELMVLATTAGSLMFSHFNDIGFWMFREYYNASVRDTFLIWTVMESIVAVVGLVGTLLLALI